MSQNVKLIVSKNRFYNKKSLSIDEIIKNLENKGIWK